MLHYLHKKATRLWIAYFRSVFSFWCYIGISIIILWYGIWPVLQYFENYWAIIILGILMRLCISLILCSVHGYHSMRRDPAERRVLSFTFVTFIVTNCNIFRFNNISIVIFPITFLALWICATIVSLPEPNLLLDICELVCRFLGKDYSYDQHWVVCEVGLIRRILAPSKNKEFHNTHLFWQHIAMHFVVVYQVIWVLASFSMVSIENLFLLGALSLAIVVISLSMIMHLHNRLSISVRDLLGGRGHVTEEGINKLYNIKPKGLDTARIQFLLHDTLREERTDTKTIQNILSMSPGAIHLTDTDGSTPLLLACRYSSLEVVEYLARVVYRNIASKEIHNILMDARDINRDTALHYACRGKNHTVVKYLLENQMQMVTKRNTKCDLPLYLLCGTAGKNSSILDSEHLEIIWRLLLAYPEDVSHRYKT